MRFATKIKDKIHRFGQKHENSFRTAQKIGGLALIASHIGAAGLAGYHLNKEYNHSGNQAIVAESMSAIMQNKARAHDLAKSQGISYMSALHQLANE